MMIVWVAESCRPVCRMQTIQSEELRTIVRNSSLCTWHW